MAYNPHYVGKLDHTFFIAPIVEEYAMVVNT